MGTHQHGAALMALQELCSYLQDCLLQTGAVLLSGPICSQETAGPAWAVCAHLVSTGERTAVASAITHCRTLFPTCWLSTQLAAVIQAFADSQLSRVGSQHRKPTPLGGGGGSAGSDHEDDSGHKSDDEAKQIPRRSSMLKECPQPVRQTRRQFVAGCT